jgi:hypothetical protein
VEEEDSPSEPGFIFIFSDHRSAIVIVIVTIIIVTVTKKLFSIYKVLL